MTPTFPVENKKGKNKNIWKNVKISPNLALFDHIMTFMTLLKNTYCRTIYTFLIVTHGFKKSVNSVRVKIPTFPVENNKINTINSIQIILRKNKQNLEVGFFHLLTLIAGGRSFLRLFLSLKETRTNQFFLRLQLIGITNN